jgi:hypothetical protein
MPYSEHEHMQNETADNNKIVISHVTKLYAVFDKKAFAFQNFFFAKNDIEAIRSFQTAVNDPQTQLSQYSSDFELFHVANIDQESAKIYSNIPASLGVASDYIRKSSQ